MSLFKIIGLGFALTVCASCSTSPLGRSQLTLMPDSQMDSMGLQAFDEIKKQTAINQDARTNSYVRCVATAITSVLPEQRDWEIVVFQDKQVNAFALPGGKIGVYTGLLPVAATPAQLAAVLGHEVGHVLAHHSNERMTEQVGTQIGLAAAAVVLNEKSGPYYQLGMAALGVGAQYGIALPHSRTQESEADLIGLQLMAKAGFDPHDAVDLWHNMDKAASGQPPEWLSDHPSNSNRITSLQEHMDEAVRLYRAAGNHPHCVR